MTRTSRPTWLTREVAPFNAQRLQHSIAALLLMCLASVGCQRSKTGDDLMTIDDPEVSAQSDRFALMSFAVFSYVDYDIYDSYILPAEGNPVGSMIPLPSVQASRSPQNWGGINSGGTFYWDRQWTPPKRFKILWLRVVDASKFGADPSYDRYTRKETEPGAAWCETTVTIDQGLPAEPNFFTLHFYPDGHVEGRLTGLREDDALKPRFSFATRSSLPVLAGKACLKEVSNPFFGKKKPTPMN